MHSKLKGNIGELVCAAELAKLGFSVFKELGDISKIDLIAEKEGRLTRFQCKAYTQEDGTLTAYMTKAGPGYKFKYGKDDFDYMSVYDLTGGELYVLPIALFENKNRLTLRLVPTVNGQKYESHWATNYLFQKILS